MGLVPQNSRKEVRIYFLINTCSIATVSALHLCHMIYFHAYPTAPRGCLFVCLSVGALNQPWFPPGVTRLILYLRVKELGRLQQHFISMFSVSECRFVTTDVYWLFIGANLRLTSFTAKADLMFLNFRPNQVNCFLTSCWVFWPLLYVSHVGGPKITAPMYSNGIYYTCEWEILCYPSCVWYF